LHDLPDFCCSEHDQIGFSILMLATVTTFFALKTQFADFPGYIIDLSHKLNKGGL
jgi:hypothetical protein